MSKRPSRKALTPGSRSSLDTSVEGRLLGDIRSLIEGVESSCKNLVGSRLKQAGMRWTRQGAQAILQLRLAILNDRWDHLWGPGQKRWANA